uniref:Uncharacterized protein n=1 Tax=Setaria italica TaxID=4555 RepID=K3ZGS6_SETIT
MWSGDVGESEEEGGWRRQRRASGSSAHREVGGPTLGFGWRRVLRGWWERRGGRAEGSQRRKWTVEGRRRDWRVREFSADRNRIGVTVEEGSAEERTAQIACSVGRSASGGKTYEKKVFLLLRSRDEQQHMHKWWAGKAALLLGQK